MVAHLDDWHTLLLLRIPTGGIERHLADWAAVGGIERLLLRLSEWVHLLFAKDLLAHELLNATELRNELLMHAVSNVLMVWFKLDGSI